MTGPTHDSAWDIFASDEPRAMVSRFPGVHGTWQTGWFVGVVVALVLITVSVVVWVLVTAQRARDDVDVSRMARWTAEMRALGEDELLRYTGGKIRPAVPHTHSDLGWPR